MADDKTYDFVCGEPGCEFTSFGHSTKKAMTARGAEHKAEHASGEAAPELADSKATTR